MLITHQWFCSFQKKCIDASTVEGNSGRESDMCRLVNTAEQLQFCVVPTDGNGNCMFLALAEQLEIHGPESAQQVRHDIIAYLKEHPEIVEHVDFTVEGNKSFDEYVTNMSKEGTWGDGIVLETAVKLY